YHRASRLPREWAHLLGGPGGELHRDDGPGVTAEADDASDRAVDPSIGLIVVEHHDLGADLESKNLVDGWLEQAQVAGLPCAVRYLVTGQSFQVLSIAGRHDPVG